MIAITLRYWSIWSLKRFDTNISLAINETQKKLDNLSKSTNKTIFPETMLQDMFMQEICKNYHNKSMLNEAKRRSGLWLSSTLKCNFTFEYMKTFLKKDLVAYQNERYSYLYVFMAVEVNKKLLSTYPLGYELPIDQRMFWEEIIDNASEEFLILLLKDPVFKALPDSLLQRPTT